MTDISRQDYFERSRAIRENTRAMKDLAKAIRSSQPRPTIVNQHIESDYYDEQTLSKVLRVLDNVGSIQYTGTDIISMLQNEGILFRERR